MAQFCSKEFVQCLKINYNNTIFKLPMKFEYNPIESKILTLFGVMNVNYFDCGYGFKGVHR